MIYRTGSFLIAIASKLFLVALFCSALVRPLEFKDFIYRTGLMIYVIEFMSLHSSGMFFGSSQQAKTTGKPAFGLKAKLAMILFYSVFVLGFTIQTGQWLAAVYFVVSLASKAFFSRSIDPQKRMAPVAAGIAMLLISTFIVVLTADHLAHWFPYSSAVKSARLPDTGGLFVSKPQTLMAWGAIYFTLMTFCEVMIYRKAPRGTGSLTPAKSGI